MLEKIETIYTYTCSDPDVPPHLRCVAAHKADHTLHINWTVTDETEEKARQKLIDMMNGTYDKLRREIAKRKREEAEREARRNAPPVIEVRRMAPKAEAAPLPEAPPARVRQRPTA